MRAMSQLNLAVEIGGLKLRNPTMNAAGVLGLSASLLERVYEAGAGGVVTKSIGLHPRRGHPNPTMVALEVGILNSMGLPNPGAAYFANEVKRLRGMEIPVVASIFGSSPEEFIEVARIIAEGGADALELNCSCPTVGRERCLLDADPENIERVTSAVKGAVDLPVFVKLSPNVGDIVECARASERGGADAITAVNTLKGIAIDAELRRPILSNIMGGLSGPALKPVALRCIWEIVEEVEIPVIGCGGISTWRDAVEFLLCGASAIQIGTAIMSRGLQVYDEVLRGLRSYLEGNGFRDVREIVGIAHWA